MIVLALVLVVFSVCGDVSLSVTTENVKVLQCVFSREIERDGVELEIKDDEHGQVFVDDQNNTLIRCAANVLSCYTFWQDVNNVTEIKAQGCWDTPKESSECSRNECVSNKKPMKLINTARFCCCSVDFCNSNISHFYDPSLDKEPKPSIISTDKHHEHDITIFILFATVVTVMSIAVILLVLKLKLCKTISCKHKPSAETHLLSTHCMTESFSIQNLNLTNIIGKGKFGSVWKGEVNEKDIAVKLFPSHYKNFFINERDIYSLPFMDHPNILSYFGSNERFNMKGEREYLLIIAYAPHGCLQEYLSQNTIDFQTFCQMAIGIAKGLAHLHSEINRGNQVKPCISHRDLNSRNILVNKDLTCSICDLGLAITLSGASFYENGEKQYPKNKSLNEVGTIRYMAPEILEGSVNLNDCELSLKQVDVYALGLVLWELATRCIDFYQCIEIPPYELPFKRELGNNPNLENVQTLVSLNKFRPLFPKMWYDKEIIRNLKCTIEDCWDEDAEARLTASCAAERLSEMTKQIQV